MRVDDYKNACRLAADELATKDPQAVANLAGATFVSAPTSWQLDFFGRPVVVSIPSGEVRWRDQQPTEEFTQTDAVLVLHYLLGSKGLNPTGDMVSYRQIPGGEFYIKAFQSRAEIPLAKVFGPNPGLLTQAIEAFGGEFLPGQGDEAGCFRVLPALDIVVQLNHPDEEFESAGTVLFDRVIANYMSNEDISWLGSALVYRLMNTARTLPI